MNRLIVVLFMIGYLFNSNISEGLCPGAATDREIWDGCYYPMRNKINAVLYLLTALFMLFNTKGIAKAVAAFLVFVCFGSVVDKVIYNFYQFKATDWIIIAAGVVSGVYVYYHDRKNRGI